MMSTMPTMYSHIWHSLGRFSWPFWGAFLAVVCLTPLMIRLARRYGVLDMPAERKIHRVPVPRLGGLGIMIAFWIVAVVNMPLPGEIWAILAGGTIVGGLGVVDDIRPLSSRIRLAGQVVASLIVMSAGLTVSFCPDTVWGNALAGGITLLWILGIVNALNFADGLDGLASGMTMISSGFFFLLAMYLWQNDVAFIAAVLSGCCLGFLVYNFKPARIYLGDGGSTFLGFCLACIALYGGWSDNGFVVALGIPTIILGVLIFDMIYITVFRIRKGQVRTFQQWLDYTGKDHFHHRLMSLGFSERRAVLFIYLICLMLGLNILVLEKLRNPLGVFIIGIHSTLLFLAIFLLMGVGHGILYKKDNP